MEASASAATAAVTERRGIPAASFVQDVEIYLKQSGLDVNSSLGFLQERLQQYKIVEMKLLAQQRDLQAKIPDIEKCLDVVAMLEAKKAVEEDEYDLESIIRQSLSYQSYLEDLYTQFYNIAYNALVDRWQKHVYEFVLQSFLTCVVCFKALITDFEVTEGIYSRAKIEDNDSVCLWLGANVMLEYSPQEAKSLLETNLENAKASLEVLIGDLQFLRDQVTITQVTVARVYNWDVHQRRTKQAVKESES